MASQEGASLNGPSARLKARTLVLKEKLAAALRFSWMQTEFATEDSESRTDESTALALACFVALPSPPTDSRVHD
jgi:hypothetical protein